VAPSLAPSLRDALPSGMVAVMSDGPGMVTIVRSRYGGIYEPGEWIALPAGLIRSHPNGTWMM